MNLEKLLKDVGTYEKIGHLKVGEIYQVDLLTVHVGNVSIVKGETFKITKPLLTVLTSENAMILNMFVLKNPDLNNCLSLLVKILAENKLYYCFYPIDGNITQALEKDFYKIN